MVHFWMRLYMYRLYTSTYGEYFAMSLIQMEPAELVLPETIIVITLSSPADNEIFDLTFIATAQLLFVQLHGRPQPLRTYGRCVGYSMGAVDRPLAIGEMFRFPTVPHFIVAKRDLVTAVLTNRGPFEAEAVDASPEKRQCVRPLGEDGELADDTGSRTKGTSVYLLDLDCVRHPTRNKSEIAQRERELHFLFRAMDSGKKEYCVAADVTLQTEVYRRLLCEQGDTQAEDRTQPFLSCGLISRVQRLHIFSKTEKLKLLLTGFVLLEGSSEPTLSFEDFVTGEKVSSKSQPCPSNNAAMISALKNFQIANHILGGI
jgi:hypothetical protein